MCSYNNIMYIYVRSLKKRALRGTFRKTNKHSKCYEIKLHHVDLKKILDYIKKKKTFMKMLGKKKRYARRFKIEKQS
jgi:hypothetical protein